MNIPYNRDVHFEATGEIEIRAFDFFVDTCVDGDGFVDVSWFGFSISPKVPESALISVGKRSKEFPTETYGPGVWAVEISGFGKDLYEEVFVGPEGTTTSVTLDGETVEYFWYFPPYEELPPCHEEEGYGGGKG